MSGTSEIRHRLMIWDKGQAEAEGLAAVILSNEGYRGIDPIHPLGGPDNGKGIVFTANGTRWIGAEYFPTKGMSFANIKNKFLHDLKGVKKNNAKGMAFVCNQKLTESERVELKMLANDLDADVDIYHLERLCSLLNTPIMYGARLRFLGIEISKEEELAFLEAANKKNFDAIQKKLDELFRYIRSERADEEFWEFSSRSEAEVQTALEELFDKIWYDRHMYLAYRVENGIEKVDSEIWKGAQDSAEKVRQKYGENNLGPYSDFEWGMLNGKLSALRWMLGDDWDMLDT